MDSVGEGEGGRIWENGIETCKISYMKRVASPGSMHDTGCLGLVPWDDPEGWYGEGGGRRVQDGEHMYTCGGFISMFLYFISFSNLIPFHIFLIFFFFLFFFLINFILFSNFT